MKASPKRRRASARFTADLKDGRVLKRVSGERDDNEFLGEDGKIHSCILLLNAVFAHSQRFFPLPSK